RAIKLAREAEDNGFGVIIGAAGLAAHLSGVLAANTILPVIGIPCKGGALAGVDALYATVQMPTGIPVATVAIDGAANAAILAVQILATGDAELKEKLRAYKAELAASVDKKDANLQAKLANRGENK
ncbi:MAG: AIR carboxylase family protein, partial [Saccharofermentans sp.]|nr:AIR carboxylase family protein [Saccharofermentans sp.]